ncbi:MAG: type II toxin-antitoxin system RelE/ParE family toxin [Deltaproteobacteria bacterium]|nr:type II toxin-antitoxin system RelE/ParE family toxin [Deltaproteobacteria bacterium]
MSVAYRLLYHAAVLSEDVPQLDRRQRRTIQRAIEERIVQDPIRFGAPLRRGLYGYRKLRVGDYRIIYEVRGRDIMIYTIGHRREVYTGVATRLPK